MSQTTKSNKEKSDSKIPKINIINKVLENPETFNMLEKVLGNPRVQGIIDKVFFKKTVLYGLPMAFLITGILTMVDSLKIFLELDWVGGLGIGVVMTGCGSFFTIKKLLQGRKKQKETS